MNRLISRKKRISLLEKTLFSYLVDRKICLGDDISLTKVTPLGGKNFNLKVEFSSGRSLLVKQTSPQDDGTDPTEDGFQGDGLIHALVDGILLTWQQHTVLPLDRDPENGVLILPFLSGYESLTNYYDRPGFSTVVGRLVGEILGQMHRLTHGQMEVRDRLRAVDPSLEMVTVPHTFVPLSPLTPEDFGNIRTDALIFFQAYGRLPQLAEAIEALKQDWQPSALVHQDLRLENWLLAEGRSIDLRLIDWETLGWGDPLADLGQLLAAYLGLWTDTVPETRALSPGQCLAAATFSLDQIKPTLGAVIAGYQQAFPELGRSRRDWLTVVGRYCGRSLIEQILIRMQYLLPIDNRSLCNLQLANSLLCQTDKAIPALFGIS
jgi:hypothetical protein